MQCDRSLMPITCLISCQHDVLCPELQLLQVMLSSNILVLSKGQNLYIQITNEGFPYDINGFPTWKMWDHGKCHEAIAMLETMPFQPKKETSLGRIVTSFPPIL